MVGTGARKQDVERVQSLLGASQHFAEPVVTVSLQPTLTCSAAPAVVNRRSAGDREASREGGRAIMPALMSRRTKHVIALTEGHAPALPQTALSSPCYML